MIVAAVTVLVTGMVALGVIVMPLIFGLLLAMVLWPVSTKLRARGWRPGLAAFTCWVLVALASGLLVALSIKALIGPWPAFVDGISSGLDELERRLSEAFDEDLSYRVAGRSAGLRPGGGSVAARCPGDPVGGVQRGVDVAAVDARLFFYLKDGTEMWRCRHIACRRTRRTARPHRAQRCGTPSGRSSSARRRSPSSTRSASALVRGSSVFRRCCPSRSSRTSSRSFPYFGAIFAGAIACLVALGDGGLGPAIAMLIVVLIVQQLESNLLQPVLVGRSTRLHPLVVALAVIAGGSIAGVVGMFLAVPAIAATVAAIAELRRTADGESLPADAQPVAPGA